MWYSVQVTPQAECGILCRLHNRLNVVPPLTLSCKSRAETRLVPIIFTANANLNYAYEMQSAQDTLAAYVVFSVC
jgi:hypothetical protein